MHQALVLSELDRFTVWVFIGSRHWRKTKAILCYWQYPLLLRKHWLCTAYYPQKHLLGTVPMVQVVSIGHCRLFTDGLAMPISDHILFRGMRSERSGEPLNLRPWEHSFEWVAYGSRLQQPSTDPIIGTCESCVSTASCAIFSSKSAMVRFLASK